MGLTRAQSLYSENLKRSLSVIDGFDSEYVSRVQYWRKQTIIIVLLLEELREKTIDRRESCLA